MKGRVVLLVGTSCAGKSTLARALQAEAAEPYLHWSLDGLFAAMPEGWGSGGAHSADGFAYQVSGSERRIVYGPAGRRMLDGLRAAAAAYASAGVNLVIDDMLLDAEALPAWARALEGFDTRLVLVTAEIETLRAREAARIRRSTPGLSQGHKALHDAIAADLVVRTDAETPEAAARRVLAAPPGAALARFR
jgi:chloramphenicol 3-O phosphotransferase